jgi:hypothetical protein
MFILCSQCMYHLVFVVNKLNCMQIIIDLKVKGFLIKASITEKGLYPVLTIRSIVILSIVYEYFLVIKYLGTRENITNIDILRCRGIMR